MNAQPQLWAVTRIAHPVLRDVRENCEACLALTDNAITHAAVTGSTGATFSDGPAGCTAEAMHSVTVARALTTVTR